MNDKAKALGSILGKPCMCTWNACSPCSHSCMRHACNEVKQSRTEHVKTITVALAERMLCYVDSIALHACRPRPQQQQQSGDSGILQTTSVKSVFSVSAAGLVVVAAVCSHATHY